MTTLNVQAVITAVDRLTPTLANIGGRVTSMQQRFNGAAAAASTFGQGAGIAAAGLIAATTSGQAALDEALRQFQVVGTATTKQRHEMRSLTDQVATKLGLPQLDIIKGATELLQAGLEATDLLGKGKDGVTMLEDMASGAKAAGESIASMSKDLVVLAKAFNLPWANADDRLASMRQVQGLAIVAPRLSPDSPTEHIRALAEFGAIAAQLGMSPKEASALQNTLSSAGFTGSRGGMALKTILQRMLNPTPAAQAQMMAAGFNYNSVFKHDLSGLTADTFINAMGTGGVHAEKARAAINRLIRSGVAQGDDLNLLRWKGELEAVISKSLGIKKGDAENRRIVKKSIDNITATASGGLDVVKFLEELGKMPVASFKDLVGLHHATKGAVLKFQESLRQYKLNLEKTDAWAPYAVEEGLKVKLEGFAFSVGRLSASWTSFKNALNTSGAFGAVLDRLSGTLEHLTNMDPKNLDRLSKAISGLGIGLAGLAAASGGVWLLARVGAILTGPLGKLLLGGGFAAFIAQMSGGFRPQEFNVNGAMQQGASPVMEFLNELTGLAGDLSGLFSDAISAVSEFANIDLISSPLITGLKITTGLLRDARDLIAWVRGSEVSEGRDPFQYVRPPNAYNEDGSRAWWNPLPTKLPAPYDEWWGNAKSWWGGEQGGTDRLDGASVVERLNSPLQVIMSEPPVAKLEGSGSVDVRVRVEGPGEVTSVSAADDGKNLKLNTGGGMPDTNR